MTARARWPAITILIVVMCIVGLTGCGGGQAASSSVRAPTATQTRTVTVTTTTSAARRSTSVRSVPRSKQTTHCEPQYGSTYVSEVFCYLRRAGARNQLIESDCGPLLVSQLRASGRACLDDIERYQRLLGTAQSALRLDDVRTIPTNLRGSAVWLGRAVSDELRASELAVGAIRAHDLLGFLKAWGLHGHAGRELQIAGSKFSNE
jgi:hypothetical protein